VIEVAVYIVREGRVIVFPDASVAKLSGNTQTVHVIRDDVIIGNFPARTVAYYGIELPPCYQKQYETQLAWESLSPEERGRISAEAQARRKGLTPPAEQEGEKSE
jgi:hypothetical protein